MSRIADYLDRGGEPNLGMALNAMADNHVNLRRFLNNLGVALIRCDKLEGYTTLMLLAHDNGTTELRVLRDGGMSVTTREYHYAQRDVAERDYESVLEKEMTKVAFNTLVRGS